METEQPHESRNAAAVRVILTQRQFGVCLACHAGLGDGFDVHHRKRRRDLAADELWCPCALVALHHDCHMDVHAHPAASVERGLIVSAWADQRTIPVASRWPFIGSLLLRCNGGVDLQ